MEHQFREDGSHYNGGAAFFGYGYRAIGEPRLKMIRRWYRPSGRTEDRFFVDGAHVDNYDAAVSALKSPVTFTEDEIAALRQIGDEAVDLRQVIDFSVAAALRDKGATAYERPGWCKRTDAGRSALIPATSCAAPASTSSGRATP